MIYLDYVATTPVNPEVLQSFVTVSEKYWGNPSALHKFGAVAESLLTKARTNILNILNAKNYNLIFTSCATEANNLGIKGITEQYKWRGKHIITTEVEHPSVYNVFTYLENNGYEVTYLPVNENGIISVEQLKKALRDDTILVSVMHVNNEVGSIMPIDEIGTILKNYPKILFHVDMVQSIGKIKYDFNRNYVDLFSFSAHKIYGLKGTGALIYKKDLLFSPQIIGGSQEFRLRAGTTDVASAVACSKAVRLVYDDVDKNYQHVKVFNEILRQEIAQYNDVYVNSPSENVTPYILNFSVVGIRPETFIHAFEEHNIFLSTRSACSSKEVVPSRIILAMGLDADRAKSSIRLSLSHLSTKEEIDTFLKILPKVLKKLKG